MLIHNWVIKQNSILTRAPIPRPFVQISQYLFMEFDLILNLKRKYYAHVILRLELKIY